MRQTYHSDRSFANDWGESEESITILCETIPQNLVF